LVGAIPPGGKPPPRHESIFERVQARPYLDLLDAAAAGKGIEAQLVPNRDIAAPQRTRG